jgi:hypothetical protein
MPVPDQVIFGPNAPSGSITYGEVRHLLAHEQLRALHRRLGSYFISQVSELGKPGGGSSKVYSPFPLFLMTCVGIETIGKVFFNRPPKDGEKPEDIQREGFLSVCNKLHIHLSRPLTKAQKADYDSLWGLNAHKNAKTASTIIYRLGRHTIVHGYQGRGVFLTEGLDTYRLESGAIIINPYWFWRAFLAVYEDLWIQLYSSAENNNPLKKSAHLYLNELLH